jgi:hypothetical protein
MVAPVVQLSNRLVDDLKVLYELQPLIEINKIREMA